MNLLYRCGWLLARLVSFVIFRMKVTGSENIPWEGGFVLASNHASYFDPPFVGGLLKRPVHYMAKRELFRIGLFGAILRRVHAIPTARGEVDRATLRRFAEVVQSGGVLLVFPEGTRPKTGEFLRARAGVGLIAHKVGAPIIPVYLHGTNDLSACFWGRDRLRAVIGRPVVAEWLASLPKGKETYQLVADTVMERIADLKTAVCR
jgi:1-acyl-sn-glycerol-3-phosphate acyltransferase